MRMCRLPSGLHEMRRMLSRPGNVRPSAQQLARYIATYGHVGGVASLAPHR